MITQWTGPWSSQLMMNVGGWENFPDETLVDLWPRWWMWWAGKKEDKEGNLYEPIHIVRGHAMLTEEGFLYCVSEKLASKTREFALPTCKESDMPKWE